MKKMKIYQTLFIALVFSFLTENAWSYKTPARSNTSTGGPSGMASDVVIGDSRAAACAPAVGLQILAGNNVEAVLETGGNLWQYRATSKAGYEVPRVLNGNGPCSIYAGALWLAGRSPDQQLKLAAVTFRTDGNDFWPGPLTNDGTAEVTPAVCQQYDQFFISGRRDAELHRLYFDLQSNPAELEAVFGEAGYSTPGYFSNYPAMGNTAAGQDRYLAPFYDYDGDGDYNPENGDYPFYDFRREIDCKLRRREDIVPLFGDTTYYWIFNDKGNIHTESQGLPIGMEIRAQAFAFSTTDEINNMTFLNYVIINQGTQTLDSTYFGSWVDPDLGCPQDDYVGCDVQRGLGYCYNGRNDDQDCSGILGYGSNPPAVGVDFFEGPYQDADDLDNPRTTDIINAEDSLGIPYRGLGIGYGDGIIDNERFGMRRFVYYNNQPQNQVNGDPQVPLHYYNLMLGKWKNNQRMTYGGNGTGSGVGATNTVADYMFPGTSDTLFWGTGGTSVAEWSEITAGNAENDRRFIQAAGPFILRPGDYNNITVGVVWARATTGNAYDSVNLLKEADDKAQALFDNCFELVSGPDAPDVALQELDKEVILMLSNNNPISNNYLEGYGIRNKRAGFDPGIPEQLADGTALDTAARTYKFEGYMVYQLANATTNANDLGDATKARLIAQCDLQNGVSRIINYVRDETTNLVVPVLKVDGSDQGIVRSFKITTDAFATGENSLINFKTYYFMVIAYGYNNYLNYDVGSGRGQATPFIASRRSSVGEIQRYAAIPHKVTPEEMGTIQNSTYGQGVAITQVEGRGNGLFDMIMDGATERKIIQDGFAPTVTYLPGAGPLGVKVVDPLRVVGTDYQLALSDISGLYDGNASDSLQWILIDLATNDTIYKSIKEFTIRSEEVIVNRGISIDWGAYVYKDNTGAVIKTYTDFISGSYEFENPDEPWLAGVPDAEGLEARNWIRAGSVKSGDNAAAAEKYFDDYFYGAANTTTPVYYDARENYEKVARGVIAPYVLGSFSSVFNGFAPTDSITRGDLDQLNTIRYSSLWGLNNVDIVITPNKDLWTRCPVFEEQFVSGLAEDADGNTATAPKKMTLRLHPSVDKNGNPDGSGTIGMSWFPGYAIDAGTGERLNMAFGEDSWLTGDNGRDMLWNPSADFANFGGQHWVYVFKNSAYEENDGDLMPRYDEGQYMYSKLSSNSFNPTNAVRRQMMKSCTWVFAPLLNSQFQYRSVSDGLVPNEVRIRLRVAKPYNRYHPGSPNITDYAGAENKWRNLYAFSTRGLEPTLSNQTALVSATNMINVVPNPYYAFSSYESSKIDNRIKIINLPKTCTISIFDMNGTMVRQFKKGDESTYLDWDLKNFRNVPIASGTYIIHVEVPGGGVKILKWFGVMRPIDVQNF